MATPCSPPISNSTRARPRADRQDTCRHPFGPGGSPIAPVGGYAMAIPANIAPERLAAAADALIMFTSPEAQKLYIQNGSRTNPRYSVSADPEVRRSSSIFEAVDGMSWRDELQFWPRPPVPEISDIISICGEELHDMLRGTSQSKAGSAQGASPCRPDHQGKQRLAHRGGNHGPPIA